MKTSIRLLAVGLAAGLFATPAFASSHVVNLSDENVQVYWEAAGCAGMKGACSDAVEIKVCKKTTLGPGEESDYTFKDGSSDRKVVVLNCQGSLGGMSNKTGTANKGSQKRCAITLDNKRDPTVKCGYSQEEYQALKNR